VPDRRCHASQRIKGHSGRLVPRNPRYAAHWIYPVEVVRNARYAYSRTVHIFRVVIKPNRSREEGGCRSSDERKVEGQHRLSCRSFRRGPASGRSASLAPTISRRRRVWRGVPKFCIGNDICNLMAPRFIVSTLPKCGTSATAMWAGRRSCNKTPTT